MKAHHHPSDIQKQYRIVFTAAPQPIRAGEKVALSFRPQLEAHLQEIIPLEVVHEMAMHLLIVSSDLSYFVHLHPVAGETGNYTAEHVFPVGGTYVLFEDFVPQGEEHQVGRQEITVTGEAQPSAAALSETLSWQEDGYQLNIVNPDLPFRVAAPVAIQVRVEREGEPVTDLSDYLGARAHVVIISEDTRQYVHVHPLPSEDKGPEIVFHTQFTQPGKYKVFLQFNHWGRIRTAAFVLSILQAGKSVD